MKIHHYGNAALLLNIAPSLAAGWVYRIGQRSYVSILWANGPR